MPMLARPAKRRSPANASVSHPDRSSVALGAALVGAAFVGAAYAAAALAWRAGYGPNLGPPLWVPSPTTLLVVRCALVLSVFGAAALALYDRRRAALAVALVVVACAPAAGRATYSPEDGVLWTSQIARAGQMESGAGRLALGAWAVGSLLTLALVLALTAPRKREPSSSHGTAGWGEGRALKDAERGLVLGRAAGRVPDVGGAVPDEDRPAKGRTAKKRAGRAGPLLRHDGPGHVLTVAPTRAGKGVGAVIPNLLDHPGPVIVTDPKGENVALTARFRADVLGHHVVALDPFGLVPDALLDRGVAAEAAAASGRGTVTRGGLNPLDFTRSDSPDLQGDALALADMLVVGDEGGGDNRFFSDEARALLAGLITYVVCRGHRDDRSLVTVRRHLTTSGAEFQELVGSMAADEAFPAVRAAGNRLDQKHERERSSVVSTAQSHTHFLDSPRMAAVLAESTFDPAALRPGSGRDGDARPLSLYLVLPPDRLDTFSRWLRLTVATTITALARLGPIAGGTPPPSRRALFLLDEFAQLGPMPPVHRAVSLMAGYGLQVWPFLQDLGQLRRLYPRDWETFVANADVVQAFGTTDHGTAKYISELAGTATVFRRSETAGRSRGRHTSRTDGAAVSETARPLVTPDELMRLGSGDQVLVPRGTNPVLARRLAYYADPLFAGRLARAAAARAT